MRKPEGRLSNSQVLNQSFELKTKPPRDGITGNKLKWAAWKAYSRNFRLYFGVKSLN